MSVTKPLLATPEDAEHAFYEAIEHQDVEAMMAVWAEDEEIVCTHPGGARLVGHAAVRSAWQSIFENKVKLTIQLTHQVFWHSGMMAVRNLVQSIHFTDGTSPQGPMIATNVFVRGADGWRMLAHHSSLAAALPLAPATETPRVLH